MISIRKALFILLTLAALTACNKDNTFTSDELLPTISLDSDTGRYTAKIGRQITITPIVTHADDARFTWLLNGVEISHARVLKQTFHEVGENYITLRVENSVGKAEVELLIEVVELAAPVISLAIPEEGFVVLPATDYLITPDIQHSDVEGFKIRWKLNSKVVSEEMTYTFNQSQTGDYALRIEAENEDGASSRDFSVKVVDELPYTVTFDKTYMDQPTAERHTYVGRSVSLTPRLKYFTKPSFAWFVDGESVTNATREFVFTPQKSGVYEVKVRVEEATPTKAITRNITRQSTAVESTIRITASSKSEAEGLRRQTASSSRYAQKVYDYTPAPGQHIGDQNAGFTGGEQTTAAAIAYAERRMKESSEQVNADKTYLSLGGFGGYVVVGFDHSVTKSKGEYDFAIQGNAFATSSEPGVVWVMQDVNGNQLPDDEWYELRGSETAKQETLHHYTVTYYRPAGSGMPVQWVDSEGQRGTIDYLKTQHPQPYYYPAWITEDSYSLSGTRLKPRNVLENNVWKNRPYDWGYADNYGDDTLNQQDTSTGSGQANGFKLSNAMTADHRPVDLQYIDFVKIQSAVNAQSGSLGELSTDIFTIYDVE